MTDFLGALINRHSDTEPQILPRLPSLYESETPFNELGVALPEKPGGLEEESVRIEPSAQMNEATPRPADMASLSPHLHRAGPDESTTLLNTGHGESMLTNLARDRTPNAKPPKSSEGELVESVTPSRDDRTVEKRGQRPLDPTPSRPVQGESTLTNLARDPTPTAKPPKSPNGELVQPCTSGRDDGTVEQRARRPITRHIGTNLEPRAESQMEPSARLPAASSEDRPAAPQRPLGGPPPLPSKRGTADPGDLEDPRYPSLALGDTAKPSHPPLMPSASLLTPAVPPIPLPERPSPKPEPVINVTIGRVEVRATTSPQKQPAKPVTRPPVMGLDEYLRRRTGRHDR